MIVISAESSCDLSAEYIDTHKVRIMLHYIVTDKGKFYDGIEVTGKNIIEYKHRVGSFPDSKSPKVEDYRNEFKRYVDEMKNTNISIIHITPGIQAYKSYGTACYAAKTFDNVYITDSQQVSYGYGMVVKEACRLRDEGYDAKTILEKLEEYKSSVRTYMLIRDFDCLKNVDKSISKFEFFMKVFGVYPYFCIHGDKYIFKGLVFGGKGRLYKNFSKMIIRRMKGATDKKIITSKYNMKEIRELRAVLDRLGDEELNSVSIRRVSCSEVCRYGESMLGIAGVINL